MFRPTLACLLVLFAGCTFGTTARADIRMGDGSPLPDRARLGLSPNKVRVAHEGCKLTERAAPRGPNNPDVFRPRPLAYMEQFFYVDQWPRGNRPGGEPPAYLLLASSSPDGQRVQEVFGWVDGHSALMTEEALKEPASDTYLKALIVNTVANVQDASGGVKFRLAPEEASSPRGDEVQLFNIFFVYGKTPNFFLLGTAPSFGSVDDPGKVVLGWVPRRRAEEWSTRQGFDWAPYDSANSRTTPGRIFRTARDAVAALRGQSPDPLFVEAPLESPPGSGGRPSTAAPGRTVHGRQLPYDQTRFPILAWNQNERSPRELLNNHLERVGVIGDFDDMKAGDVHDLQRKLNRFESQASQIEILFVVDETASMEPWFPVVARTIQQILRAVRPGEGGAGSPTLRVGVAYYSDAPEPLVKPARLEDVGQGADALVREVAGHRPKIAPPEIDDSRERVFLGLGTALDRANFTPLARKLVVLLGDMGNKVVAPEPSADELIERLAPTRDNAHLSLSVRDTPKEFYAIQLCDPESFPASREFRAQMSGIAQAVRQRIAARFPGEPDAGKLSEYTVATQANTDRVVGLIVDRARALRERVGTMAQEISGLRRNWNTRIGPELERMITEFGIPLDELRKKKGLQLFEEGYVWKKNADGQEQIREQMLSNGGELEDYLSVTRGLMRRPEAGGRRSVSDFLKEAIQKQIGSLNEQEIEQQSFSGMMRNSTVLPFQSPLLNRAIGRGQNGRFEQAELYLIIKKRMMVEDMLRNVTHDYDEEHINSAGEDVVRFRQIGSAKPRQRSFSLGGDRQISWYWIDLTEEWP
jgi:hypothetical protein